MSKMHIYLPELRDQLRVAATGTSPRHVRRAQRGPRALAGATLAAAAAATIAFALGAGSDPQATAKQVRSDGTLLNSRFAVFDRPSDSGEPGNPFSATASPALLDPLATDGRLTLDPDSVHHLALPGRDVWVAASSAKVCISAASRMDEGVLLGACARPARIIADGMFTVSRPAPTSPNATRAEIMGLVPDGVRKVTIVLANGSTVDVDVADNGLATSLPSTPTRVRFRDDSGARHAAEL